MEVQRSINRIATIHDAININVHININIQVCNGVSGSIISPLLSC